MKRETIKVGNIYFECSWLSSDVPVPEIISWVYDGSEEDKERGIIHRFIDPEWYYLKNILDELSEEQRESYTKPNGPKIIIVNDIDLEDMLYDLDELNGFVKNLGSEPNAARIYSA